MQPSAWSALALKPLPLLLVASSRLFWHFKIGGVLRVGQDAVQCSQRLGVLDSNCLQPNGILYLLLLYCCYDLSMI